MLDGAPIAYWIGFHVVVLVLIVADLAVLSQVRPLPEPATALFSSCCFCPRRMFRRVDWPR